MTTSQLLNTLLTFIKSQQLSNGSFQSFSFTDASKKQTPVSTTFTTSLILGCLESMAKLPEAKNIIDPAVNFLLSDKNSNWSWNYWQKNSPETAASPYPNDWDDTACALIALSLHRKEIITPEVIGAITKLLVATENTPGGPYNTWMINTQSNDWKDVDPVVNANIGYFLKLHNINLPPLEKYIENIITSNNCTSRYYHNPETIIYFMARYYSGPLMQSLSQYLLNRQQKNGLWKNDLLTALAVSTLIRTHTDSNFLQSAIHHLKKAAQTNNWQVHPLYIENNKKSKLYNGAPVLTAAFVLETLVLWNNRHNNNAQKTITRKNSYPEKIHNTIFKNVNNRLAHFPRESIEKTNILLEKMLQKDPGKQITLLPYFFAQSLKLPTPLSDITFQNLGQANLYGWLAYTIYDDIMDQDSDPELLPVANLCLRELIYIYKDILPTESFAFFHTLMDKMEYANAWEYKNCKITHRQIITKQNTTKYPCNILSDKSLPHAFSALTILLLSNYKIQSQAVQYTFNFFKNYLSARQLHDDAHDWQEDLNKGFLNSLSLPLINAYFKANPKLINLNINEKRSSLQNFFWKNYIIKAGLEIDVYINKAETNLDQLIKLNIINEATYYKKLLLPLKQSAHKIAISKKEIKDFLTSFQA